MSTDAQRVFADALGLPEHDRAELAVRLIESLDERQDDDVEAAWDAEVARRIEELDSGAVKAIPWEKARGYVLGERDDLATP